MFYPKRLGCNFKLCQYRITIYSELRVLQVFYNQANIQTTEAFYSNFDYGDSNEHYNIH
jgi:hypothetical protein